MMKPRPMAEANGPINTSICNECEGNWLMPTISPNMCLFGQNIWKKVTPLLMRVKQEMGVDDVFPHGISMCVGHAVEVGVCLVTAFGNW